MRQVAAPGRLRHYLTVSWVVGIVGFTLARFFVARGTIGDDINIWLFGFIDLATAVPYAIGVAKVVGGIVDRDAQAVRRWGVVAAACFLAPYLYVAWAGRDASFPPIVWIVLGLLLVGFGANALYDIRRKVAQERTESFS